MPDHYRPYIVIMELLDYKNLRGLNLEGRTPWKEVTGCHASAKFVWGWEGE